MKLILRAACAALFFLSAAAVAGGDGVYTQSTDMAMDEAYSAVYAELENQKFWVVFEANMGKRMAGMAERWGDRYNRQGVGGIKAMVFCNIWWTNEIASTDPDLLALCPLHLALYEKDGKVTVSLPRPTALAVGSPGIESARKLEQELIAIINKALGGE